VDEKRRLEQEALWFEEKVKREQMEILQQEEAEKQKKENKDIA
jgi:hypothetical protein